MTTPTRTEFEAAAYRELWAKHHTDDAGDGWLFFRFLCPEEQYASMTEEERGGSLDTAIAAAMRWPTVPSTSNDEVQRLRAGLEDVLAYVRGKDDLYANGALRQIVEDALGGGDWPTVPQEPCFCDQTGLGEPGVSCGDCPNRDYGSAPTPKEQAGWRPIESAPTDRDVLLYSPRFSLPNIGNWRDYKGINHPGYTHWMPPPPYPTVPEVK